MTPKQNGAGRGWPTPKAESQTRSFYHATALVEAAAALIAIDEAGALPDLGDWIGAARREHRRHEQERTIGEGIYIDQLADTLAGATGIDRTQCWLAVRESVRPGWAQTALEEITAFAERMEARA